MLFGTINGSELLSISTNSFYDIRLSEIKRLNTCFPVPKKRLCLISTAIERIGS